MPVSQRQSPDFDISIETRVEIIEVCGEWFVHVIKDGQEQSRSFELESFALAFAEGQRLRLQLDKIVRL
jgi:hypothetical protein